MKQQLHSNEQRNQDPQKKVVAHERENDRTKRSEKQGVKKPNTHRSNRVEHDGSDHVL
jgi:hypothetical protein